MSLFDNSPVLERNVVTFVLILCLLFSPTILKIKNLNPQLRGDLVSICIITGLCALGISESFWTAGFVIIVVLVILPDLFVKELNTTNKFSLVNWLSGLSEQNITNKKEIAEEKKWEDSPAYGMSSGSLTSFKTTGGRPDTFRKKTKEKNRINIKERTVLNTLGSWYPKQFQDKELCYSKECCASGMATAGGCIKDNTFSNGIL